KRKLIQGTIRPTKRTLKKDWYNKEEYNSIDELQERSGAVGIRTRKLFLRKEDGLCMNLCLDHDILETGLSKEEESDYQVSCFAYLQDNLSIFQRSRRGIKTQLYITNITNITKDQ